MNSYRIAWFIDIEADTPLEAAQQAWSIQQDIHSTATIFTVINADNIAVCIDAENGEVYPSDWPDVAPRGAE